MRIYYGNGFGMALQKNNYETLIYKEGSKIFSLYLDGSIKEDESGSKKCPYGDGSNFDFWFEHKIISPANEETLKRFKIGEIEDGYYIPANSKGFIYNKPIDLDTYDISADWCYTVKYTMFRENGNWQSALISGDGFEVNYPAESVEAKNLDNQVLNGEIIKVEVEETE